MATSQKLQRLSPEFQEAIDKIREPFRAIVEDLSGISTHFTLESKGLGEVKEDLSALFQQGYTQVASP